MSNVTRPLRIGLLMHSLNPRGGVVHTLELAEALHARGHDVTVFAAARPGQRLFRPTRVRLSIAPLGELPADLVGMVGARMAAMAAHLRALPDLAEHDVLHSQDSITANALATLRDEARIAAFVRTVHHLDAFADGTLTAWQARGVRAASRVLCVSGVWQDVLHTEWGRRADRVGNGVNLQRFRAQVGPAQLAADAACCRALGVQARGPVWLAVGGIEARKNTTRLVHAFAQALRRRPDAQLVIAGGASLLDHAPAVQAFQDACAHHGLAAGQAHADRLLLTGPLPDDALPALYRRASAVAMPSLREGFGLVVLEALACGTPAIASRIAPFTEHLGEHEVIWTNPFDTTDMARALLDSLDPHVAGRVRAGAMAVCERMSWTRSAAQHEHLYHLHRASLATAARPDPIAEAHPHA
jgi:glycosyltransferase-like protein